MRYKIHTNDLPAWALRERKQPHSFLDFMDEPRHDPGDGRPPLSDEEVFLRRQYEAAMQNNRPALHWLLKRIIGERAEQLKAADKRAWVTISGIPSIAPLEPALTALRCIAVEQPEAGSKEPARVRFSPWFEEALEARFPEDKLAPAKKWIAEGGYQCPRVNRDECD